MRDQCEIFVYSEAKVKDQLVGAAETAASAGVGALRNPVIFASLSFFFLNFLLPIYARQEFQASATSIGLLFSLFSVITMIARPLVGWGLDHIGRKPFLVAAILFYAAAMFLFALGRNLEVLYVARMVQGFGSSLLWIAAYTIATELSATGERGRSVGVVDGASAMGGFFGAMIGFTMFYASDLSLRAGWMIIFAIYGLGALVGAFLALRKVPETRPVAPAEKEEHPLNLRELGKLMVVVAITGASTTMLSPLLLVFLQDRFTQDIRVLGMAFIPMGLAYSFLPQRLGRLSDRFGRPAIMAIGLVISGIISFCIPLSPFLILLAALWTLEAVGFCAASPAQEALVADLTGSTLRGTGYGIYTFAASLGAAIGPLAGGWLYDSFGHPVPFYLNGAVLLLSAVYIVLVLGRNRRESKTSISSI